MPKTEKYSLKEPETENMVEVQFLKKFEWFY